MEDKIDLAEMIQAIKMDPDFSKVGMIASHLGVVRETSLSGRRVKEIDVSFDKDAINMIVRDTKKMPGIVEVLVRTCGGRLKIGDDIMGVVVGGDTRDHVFPALISTVERIKKNGGTKRELF